MTGDMLAEWRESCAPHNFGVTNFVVKGGLTVWQPSYDGGISSGSWDNPRHTQRDK